MYIYITPTKNQEIKERIIQKYISELKDKSTLYLSDEMERMDTALLIECSDNKKRVGCQVCRKAYGKCFFNEIRSDNPDYDTLSKVLKYFNVYINEGDVEEYAYYNTFLHGLI